MSVTNFVKFLFFFLLDIQIERPDYHFPGGSYVLDENLEYV